MLITRLSFTVWAMEIFVYFLVKSWITRNIIGSTFYLIKHSNEGKIVVSSDIDLSPAAFNMFLSCFHVSLFRWPHLANNSLRNTTRFSSRTIQCTSGSYILDISHVSMACIRVKDQFEEREANGKFRFIFSLNLIYFLILLSHGERKYR